MMILWLPHDQGPLCNITELLRISLPPRTHISVLRLPSGTNIWTVSPSLFTELHEFTASWIPIVMMLWACLSSLCASSAFWRVSLVPSGSCSYREIPTIETFGTYCRIYDRRKFSSQESHATNTWILPSNLNAINEQSCSFLLWCVRSVLAKQNRVCLICCCTMCAFSKDCRWNSPIYSKTYLYHSFFCSVLSGQDNWQ